MLDSANRYSSQITILLLVAGLELEVAQLADGVCYLRDPVDVDSADGELVVKLDDRETRHQVHLPHGIRRDQKAVNFF